MTYHMEQTRLMTTGNVLEESAENRLKMNSMVFTRNIVAPPEKRIPFPIRLWGAVNLNQGVLSWTSDGEAFTVDEETFEVEVMWKYPGLVQIPSFANFRRQLRAYNFEWTIMDGNQLVFFHPSFLRSMPEAVNLITTRRKATESKAKTGTATNTDYECSSKGVKRSFSSAGLDTSPDSSVNGEIDPCDNTDTDKQAGYKKRKYRRKRPAPAATLGMASSESSTTQEQFTFNPMINKVNVKPSQLIDNIQLPPIPPLPDAPVPKYNNLNNINNNIPNLVQPQRQPVMNQTNWNLNQSLRYPLETSVNGSYNKHYGCYSQMSPQVYNPTRSVLPSYNSACVHHCCYRCGIAWYSSVPQPQQYYTVPTQYKSNATYPVQYYQEAPVYTTSYINEGQPNAPPGQPIQQTNLAPVQYQEQVPSEVQGEITVITAGTSPETTNTTPMESICENNAYQMTPIPITGNQNITQVASPAPEVMVRYPQNQMPIMQGPRVVMEENEESSLGSPASYHSLAICTSGVESQGTTDIDSEDQENDEVTNYVVL